MTERDGRKEESEEEERLCERLLAKLEAGERDAEFQGLLEELRPRIQRTVCAVCRKWGSMPDPSVEVKDVVNEVFTRLLARPPSRMGTAKEAGAGGAEDSAWESLSRLMGTSSTPGGKESARARLLKWVKVTTFRYLVSEYRKERHIDRRKKGEGSDEFAQIPTGDPVPIRKLENNLDFQRFRDYLARVYPLGAEFIEASLRYPYADSVELARVLGVTVDNLRARKSRTKKLAVIFLSSGSS